MSQEATATVPDLDFDTPSARRKRKVRALKDRIASLGIGIGGISVIIAILLIFFYLLYEVLPLFQSAEVEPWQQNGAVVEPYALPGGGQTLYLAMEEQAEIGLRLTDTPALVFFDTRSGDIVSEQPVALAEGVSIRSVVDISPARRLFALGLSDGTALVLRHDYKSSYPDGKRVITPEIAYPLGEAPIAVGERPLDLLAVNGDGDDWRLVGGSDGVLTRTDVSLTENFLTGEVQADVDSQLLPSQDVKPNKLLLMPDRRWLLVAAPGGKLVVKDLQSSDAVPQVLPATTGEIRQFELLLGGTSLMLADDKGLVSQWFLVRNDQGGWDMTRIRDFDNGGKPLSGFVTEHRRKGFATVDSDGTLRLFSTTAERNVLNEEVVDGDIDGIAYAPRSNALLFEKDGKLQFWAVHNEHPEISWSALWSQVWYEGYEEPSYVWQSSAANNDFEPKYSLMPLAFGTLKAAFYAMLLATPLAICGAIYTAYFMAPGLRRKVKPMIELMEALPTVILGFLAGLWLAPFMELNLAAVFITLLVVPLSVIAFAFVWAQMPNRIRFLLPEGWDVTLLVPVVILATMFSFAIAGPIENALFSGDMRFWVSQELGISYDQRNALVVGIAMGFAVIPTIFSITEDAIFAVPKNLSYGSLALGATPWQTLVRVVLPTASPGIFSAVMIGMGRAVGETMIVLMATGNTPIMDINIFEGMRTLAANIAVEMPESEVGSTHFRILFLAAFVLFMFTFIVNTLAESIRQHLRQKYGSL
ncbi:phosphate ABC transporter permease [Marinobacterium nitratireducens]|uniref:Phosphate ABC transporter permease n=1 Tax=Marinobacterium nitratireducens TaxID=518897 RepID=A0A917Z8U7_9GAMM|nr:ABC transporter permease subunit [Marinobacterium nitratireducens]GGO77227.1 phosphate ABC transporter permease [Marinobacterium nitratireducens]